MKKIRSKLTYANVMSTVAVFLLLGGTAVAATVVLPKNSVGAKQLKKGAVTPAKLAPAAKATLTGPRGSAGATGATGPQGPKGDQGEPGAFPTTLPSGRTLTGVYGISGHIQTSGDTGAEDAVSFQIPLAAPPVESIISAGAPTARCPGSVNEPEAAPGYLCLYEQSFFGPEPGLETEATGSGKSGFAVFLAGPTVAGGYNCFGTWAVTAP